MHGIEVEIRLQDHFKKNNLVVHKDLQRLINNKYDIITLFHVLEHISDPISLLKQLSALLDINGQIIIEVPNIEDALISLYDNNAFQKFTYWSPHLFYFSYLTLEKLIARNNLIIKNIEFNQRYPLSNHLYWLAFNKPGGHQYFNYFNDNKLDELYSRKLKTLGKCDTISITVQH